MQRLGGLRRAAPAPAVQVSTHEDPERLFVPVVVAVLADVPNLRREVRRLLLGVETLT